jgi:ribosome-associated protein
MARSVNTYLLLAAAVATLGSDAFVIRDNHLLHHPNQDLGLPPNNPRIRQTSNQCSLLLDNSPRCCRCKLAAAASQNQPDLSAEKSVKRYKEQMLEFIETPMETTVGKSSSSLENDALDDSLLDLSEAIVRAADARKAEDIVVLDVHHVSTVSSVIIVLSGNSRPQNSAITTAITKDVFEQFHQKPFPHGVPEGNAASGWILLDYGSVMVHVMTPKSRLFYNIEGQFRNKGAVEIDMSHAITPNRVMADDNMDSSDNQASEEEEVDPFWT